MDAKICDRCGKIIGNWHGDYEPIQTEYMEIQATIIKEGDYCSKCDYAMRAEAGRLYWDAYKQHRKTKEPKEKK